MGFDFLHDINGDKCSKTLMGNIEIVIGIILSVVAVIYGLGHNVKSHDVVITVILALLGGGGFSFLTSSLQKIRKVEDAKDTQNNCGCGSSTIRSD